jgi:hypothetical protein
MIPEKPKESMGGMPKSVKIRIQAKYCRDCEAGMLVCSLLHEGGSNQLPCRADGTRVDEEARGPVEC